MKSRNMKKTIITLFVASSACLVLAYSAEIGIFADHTHDSTSPISHSGGLDKNGGHTDHKTGLYHYHR